MSRSPSSWWKLASSEEELWNSASHSAACREGVSCWCLWGLQAECGQREERSATAPATAQRGGGGKGAEVCVHSPCGDALWETQGYPEDAYGQCTVQLQGFCCGECAAERGAAGATGHAPWTQAAPAQHSLPAGLPPSIPGDTATRCVPGANPCPVGQECNWASKAGTPATWGAPHPAGPP